MSNAYKTRRAKLDEQEDLRDRRRQLPPHAQARFVASKRQAERRERLEAAKALDTMPRPLKPPGRT